VRGGGARSQIQRGSLAPSSDEQSLRPTQMGSKVGDEDRAGLNGADQAIYQRPPSPVASPAFPAASSSDLRERKSSRPTC
jgi:hypothetical protein